MAFCSPHATTSLHSPRTTIPNSGFRQNQVILFTTRSSRRSNTRNGARTFQVSCAVDKPIVIGLAADSGCGKSTFMRRLTSVFGGAAEPPRGGNPDSNTLISDTTTVICLDDYHSLDRTGRKVNGVTALNPKANDFDLMYEQVKAIKEGKAIEKPIYNHVTGLLDPPETIQPPNIFVIEGLHPMYDERVRDLLDFSIYLDISNEVKFAWKIQRDMAERGHSLESIKASIESRKPDFDAYIDPQKQYADAVIEVLPTQLIPDDNEGKVLRVKLIMKEGVKFFNPVYLFDEGSTINWIPCGRKLTCSYPGIKFSYGPDTYFGQEVIHLGLFTLLHQAGKRRFIIHPKYFHMRCRKPFTPFTVEWRLPPWRDWPPPVMAVGRRNINSVLLRSTVPHIQTRHGAPPGAVHKQGVRLNVVNLIPHHTRQIKRVDYDLFPPVQLQQGGAKFWFNHEEHQQQLIPRSNQMRPVVRSVERGGVREAGGWQHLDCLVHRSAGVKVELQYLRAVGQTEEAPAEFEDRGDQGGGAGKGVLGPFGVAAWMLEEGEREEGVLGVEQ